MNEETSLIAFKSICNFINDLESEYGKKHKPLKLYKRLINQTQISHEQIIKKHLVIFHDFCIYNREAISEQNSDKITHKRLQYSDKVYIDMGHIFNISDKENKAIIWKHLLTLSALLDPTGKAKEILKKFSEQSNSGKNETDFLSNIISKVEQNVKPDANPMEAVSSIMQSGIFTEMMSEIGSKNLDLTKLLGVVQGMVSNLNDQVGDDPQTKQAMSMLNNVTNMMGDGKTPPDMSGMMQVMTSLMSNMNMTQPLPDLEKKN